MASVRVTERWMRASNLCFAISIAGLIAALNAGCGVGSDAPPPARSVAQSLSSASSDKAAQAGGVAASDRFIWAVGAHPASPDSAPVDAARDHLRAFLAAQGATPADLALAGLRAVHDLGPSGYVAWFAQRANGIEVYPSEVRLLMRPDRSLVAVTGRLPAIATRVPAFTAEVSMQTAMAKTIGEILAYPMPPEDVIALDREQGDFRYFRIQEGSPVYVPEGRIKPIYYYVTDRVVPAYFVELYVGMADDVDAFAYRYIVSATDGAVLDRRNLTVSQAFDYRVWAEASGDFRPADGPIADYSPHPAGRPDGTEPALVPSANLVRVEGFNTNPQGAADPWLSPGATETLGNNVSAYTDDNAPDGFSGDDIRATTTSSNAFDHAFDLGRGPVADETQRQASVTSLFFVNNWLHDYWYDSGFTEAAGNAQADNFGRGGVGGDVLRAEAQDSHDAGRRNNANMSTPSDGMSPRMQMYTWTGSTQRTVTANTRVLSPTGAASFGPPSFNVTGRLILAADGTGTLTDGCEALQNNVSGAVVLIDRGNCNFTTKVLNAQAAGAVAVVIANNQAGGAPTMGGTPASPITIGTVSVTQAEGNTLKGLIQAGEVSMSLAQQANPERDGSLDYMVVAHEWGHYIHNRLADCGSNMCRGMGEGWADFLALHTTLREGDDLDGAYGMGIWATRGRDEASYFGIRRVPYSVDPARNAMSFRHIANGEPLPTTHPIDPGGANSQVHNTGEVWASMLMSAYVALLRPTESSTVTFADVRRKFADYIVAGLMMTPPNATFTEQRDAILAAVSVRSADDLATMAQAFAGRGAGSCAVSPPRASTTHVGVVESFGVQPILSVGQVTVDDSVWSCDQDGIIDAEEEGFIRFEIANASPAIARATQVTLTSDTDGITLTDATGLNVPPIGPYQTQTVTVPIAAAADLVSTATLTVVLVADDPDACETTVSSTVVVQFNIDEVAGATLDDVEAASTTWTRGGTVGQQVWNREQEAPFQTVWRGIDFSSPSDTWLESPTLNVGSSPLVVQFDHRYQFEAGAADGSGTNWDGGVIEISSDNGQSWEDIEAYANPGYRGVLTDQSGNPLGNRRALVGTSPAWPATERRSLDLGTVFDGQQVRIRFRIGTDASVGDFGWSIDNIEVQGLTVGPFFRIAPDQTICPPRLVADAGFDQLVEAGAAVMLDGSGSASATGLPLSFAWVQTSGPAVELADADTARPGWVAPARTRTTSIAFALTVGDGTRTATAGVSVIVSATPAPVADAGPDQTAVTTPTVQLDGSASIFDPRTPATFTWTQLDGATVTLDDPSATMPTFDAPLFETTRELAFELALDDGARTSTDTVVIAIGALAPLIANAGPDQTTDGSESVTLDGNGSSGDPRLPFSLSWAQVSGPSVTLEATDGTARFTPTAEEEETVLAFVLTANDGRRTSTDEVEVRVAALPPSSPPPPVDDAGDGCGCSTTGERRAPTAMMWLVALVALGLGRRRSKVRATSA